MSLALRTALTCSAGWRRVMRHCLDHAHPELFVGRNATRFRRLRGATHRRANGFADCTRRNRKRSALRGLRGLAESTLDWIGNLDVKLEPWTSLGNGAHVHAGFLDAASGVFAAIQPCVASLVADGQRTLWLTGHSLGGALATLCAHMFTKVQGVYVFGSPRVGDSAFAAHYARLLWRFSNHSDVVVTVPPNWSLPFGFAREYQHVGRSVWFDVNQAMAYGESPFSFLTTQLPESVLDHAPIAYSVLSWNQIAQKDGDA